MKKLLLLTLMMMIVPLPCTESSSGIQSFSGKRLKLSSQPTRRHMTWALSTCNLPAKAGLFSGSVTPADTQFAHQPQSLCICIFSCLDHSFLRHDSLPHASSPCSRVSSPEKPSLTTLASTQSLLLTLSQWIPFTQFH